MDKKTVTLKINGSTVTVPNDMTILQAAKEAGYNIPTLCYLKDIHAQTNCRVCVVEVKGARSLVASCHALVADGMEVLTNTPKVMQSRKTTVELILSDHDKKCLSCNRNLTCELQQLSIDLECDADRFGVNNEEKFANMPLDDGNDFIVRDPKKCIKCRRCVSACNDIQGIGVIGANGRGYDTVINCVWDKELGKVPCVACGQCVVACPVAALSEKSQIQSVRQMIADPELHVIFGTAPSVRVAIGEEFGYPVGTNLTGKMITAAKKLGFDRIFDVSMTADLTIMEEGSEFLQRLNSAGAFPMMTSCCPGWVNFAEIYYPEYLKNLSSAKSPQQMFGAVMKTFYAKKNGIDPAKIRVVTVMPCLAKKGEAKREEMNVNGHRDIDAVITTHEFAKMIKAEGVDFKQLPDTEFDAPLGEASTAGLIFGASGGVMEAALRTISETVMGQPLKSLDYVQVRGTQGIKTANLKLGDKDVCVCVVSGLANARKVMEEVKTGKSPYHFIEFMACSGGCVKGGGQPHLPSPIQNQMDIRAVRASGLYAKDKTSKLRKSHENPVIKAIYAEYFEAPLSHKAHDALHTHYTKRDKF